MNPAEPGAASLLKTFQRRQLSGQAAGRLFCAMALLETLRPGDRTIVFSERIEQAEQLAAMIRRRWGNCCGIYHSHLSGEARRAELRRCLAEGLPRGTPCCQAPSWRKRDAGARIGTGKTTG